MLHIRTSINIASFSASTADPDGSIPSAMMISERRSKKVGALPGHARVVLAAAHSCLANQTMTGDVRVGVSMGTVYGSMNAVETSLTAVRGEGFDAVVPSWYATGLPNAVAAIVASWHGLRGPNLSFLGRRSGIDGIIASARQIALGRADAMLCGGFDIPSALFNRAHSCPAARAGVGLLLLNGAAADGAPARRIVGWAQRGGAGEEHAAPMEELVDIAMRHAGLSEQPRIHVVHDDAGDGHDYLAATAPVYLVRNILQDGHAGLHALVVSGTCGASACLLIAIG